LNKKSKQSTNQNKNVAGIIAAEAEESPSGDSEKVKVPSPEWLAEARKRLADAPIGWRSK
jgi:hypothetical protein